MFEKQKSIPTTYKNKLLFREDLDKEFDYVTKTYNIPENRVYELYD